MRNRLRRQLRELSRQAANSDLLGTDSMLVIVAPSAAGATMTTLSAHFHRALTQLSADSVRPATAERS